jgi:hypothetical protein
MSGREVNIPPDDFQRLLTHLGGVNRYDEPNFKIGWAQYETFTAGGVWSVDECYFRGYRELLRGSGEPCWTLFQWHAAEEYGSPEGYYLSNQDESTGFQILGEYPYCGRYEVLYNLRWHEMIDGKLTFHTIPLSPLTFELIIPIILKAQEVSLEKRRAALMEARRLDEEAKLGEIERHLREKEVPFQKGAVSFTRQGIRSTVIDQKMLEISRTMQAASANARRFRLGLSTE